MLPIIDATGLVERDPEAIARVGRDIGKACRETGFFYVRNSGISLAEIDAIFSASKAFFALPADRKEAIALGATTANRGYVGLRTEALDPGRNVDFKEAFNAGIELAANDPEIAAGVTSRGENLWPALPGFRETCLAYFDRVLDLGRALHSAIAHDLGLPADHFDPFFERPMATLRLLHYPPADLADDEYGAGAHTDYGNLTILATDDVGGLQVQRLDGVWLDAPPIPGAYVCNIGDCLMRWTKDVYRSNPHRVRNSTERDRYSVAFFLDPSPHTMVETIASCITADRPAAYPPITAAAYLTSRFAATYGFADKG